MLGVSNLWKIWSAGIGMCNFRDWPSKPHHNSWCCCNKMSSIAGCNLNYIYPHFVQEISEILLSCDKRPQHSTQSSSHSLCLFASYRGAHFTQNTLFINVFVSDKKKTTLLISSIVQVKISRFYPVIGGVSLQQHLLFQKYGVTKDNIV